MPVDPSGARLFRLGRAISNNNEMTMKFDLQHNARDKISATIGGFRNPILDLFSTPINTAFADVPLSGDNKVNNYFVNIAYSRTNAIS